MQEASWTTIAPFVLDMLIRIGFSVRIIMRRLPVGTSLAWLGVVLIFPFGGALIYLLLGELRLGKRRAEWAAKIHGPYEKWVKELRRSVAVDWSTLRRRMRAAKSLDRLRSGHSHFSRQPAAIARPERGGFSILLSPTSRPPHTPATPSYYIRNLGGRADDVAEAVLRAAGRGVKCRMRSMRSAAAVFSAAIWPPGYAREVLRSGRPCPAD